MLRQLSLLLGSTALAAMLSLPATAQEYSNGGNFKRGRQEATKTPVEAFGVHPPGPDPADQKRRIFCWWKRIFTPYYAPVSPTSTSVRWKPWCYFPLMPYYTPYYIGYCPKRCHNPKPEPYGYNGWGDGPMPDHPFPPNPAQTPLAFGPYTSTIQDDTVFWNMGGNGLVPYGTPRPVHGGPPDLVDAIQVTRQQQYGCGACVAPADGVPLAPVPAILPPGENPDMSVDKKDNKDSKDNKENKEAPASVKE
jgi:hypothetical protein